MLHQAVILAGGYGTRLGHMVKDLPKPLLQVAGEPFLHHLTWNLGRHGIKDIVLCVGYKAEKIIANLDQGHSLGVRIEYSVEPTPMGTGGALVQASSLLAPEFLLLNGDTVLDMNYFDLELHRRQAGALAAMALRQVDDVSRFGRVVVQEGMAVDFTSGSSQGPGVVNAGVYALSREVVELLPPGESSLEKDLLPRLVNQRQLAGKAYGGFFLDMGVPESLREAQTAVREWRRKPAVFLDRDGVLNKDSGYVHRKQDFHWIPGAQQAVKWLNDQGYLVFLVTNQAGIGRGYYTEAHFKKLSSWMEDELRKAGAHLDALYFCPHHPTAGQGEFLKDCSCRKPGDGMLRKAMQQWSVDVERSLLIGDKPSDLQAAECAGIKGLLFDNTDLFAFVCSRVPVLQPLPAVPETHATTLR